MKTKRRKGCSRAVEMAIALGFAAAAYLVPASQARAADQASASMVGKQGLLSRMADGDVATYWQSAAAAGAGDWVAVDRGTIKTVTSVDLYMADPKFPADRIQNGVVEVSPDKVSWTAIGTFADRSEVHLVAPAGVQARYVRVRATAAQATPIVIRELAVDRQLAGTALGSALFQSVGSISDGDPASSWRSSRAPVAGDAVTLDLGRPTPLGRIDFSMGSPAYPDNRLEAGVLEASDDARLWTAIGSFSATSDVQLKAPPGSTARYLRARAWTAQAKPLVVREFSGITQPAQPASGPGGNAYAHAGMRVSAGGSGANAYYVFEPVDPQPASAPLAVITHGFGEYSGYAMHKEFIEHTVRQGNVVIYPRWQTGLVAPCLGPFYIQPCVSSAVEGIRGGIDLLQADPSRVQPQLDKASYFGFSFGGILTANFLNRHASLGLPKPLVMFLDEPHDGGFVGTGEPALDKSLAGIPATTLVECHVGANGVLTEQPANIVNSCNAVFPKLAHIPARNKALVMSYTDTHGNPDLSSVHGVSAGAGGIGSRLDAYDWNFVWKVWDALRDRAYNGTDNPNALADTPQHRAMGAWSDGTPITPLKVQHEAPILP